MAVFTPLSHNDVEQLLAHYRVGSLRALDDIPSGIENSNFFVTTSAGQFVLTVFERLTLKQLPFYLELMRHLARRGLPVPEPQENSSGALISEIKGKPAAIVTRLSGQSIEVPSSEQCALVGGFLARMHLAGQSFRLFQPNLRGIGWWKGVLPQLEPHVADDMFHDLAEEVIFQDSFFRDPDFEKLPAGPIHADLFRDNVLFVEEGRRPLIGGVIDFYFAACSIWLFDLAVTVNDWCVEGEDGALMTERVQALLRAYHEVRPLTELEHRHWRTVLRGAALRFWISRLYDLYLPRAARLLTPKDPSRFERILKRRIGDTEPPWV